MNERAISNKVLMICWNTVMCILFIAYLLEVIKGERTIVYFIVLFSIGLIPLIIGNIKYRGNKADEKLKYLVVYGYIAFYIAALLTADTVLVFIYIFPVLSALVVCNDYKLMRNIAITSSAVNFISIAVVFIREENITADMIADREIQIAGVLLVMIMAYVACKNSVMINKMKMDVQKELVKDNLELVTSVQENIVQIYDEAKKMTNAAKATSNSISMVSESSSDTTESIHKQIDMTTDIQKLIDAGLIMTSEANNAVDNARRDVELSENNMSKLGNSAKNVNYNIEKVLENMTGLNNKSNEVKGIIDIIEKIASQTNMLALNASIEAARAGEAGKGFAVVASQITNLASQTKSATDKIAQIIDMLQKETDQAGNSVKSMTDISEQQNNVIYDTEKNFKKISEAMIIISSNVSNQSEQLNNIKASNERIVESADMIAVSNRRVTEQMKATAETTEENSNITERVKSLVGNVVKELKKFENH